MNQLIFHSANNLPIGQRQDDGYVNATALCKAAGKRWDNYLRLDSTQEYLQALSQNLGVEIITKNPLPHISATALIQVFQGGIASQQGTWIHPEVAVDLAKWLSPQFRVLVNRWIVQWMVTSPPESHQPQDSQPKKLPLYPDMSEDTFKALPPADQGHFAETAYQREMRQKYERQESIQWLQRCWRKI